MRGPNFGAGSGENKAPLGWVMSETSRDAIQGDLAENDNVKAMEDLLEPFKRKAAK